MSIMQERDTLHPAPSTGLPQTVADVRDAVREAAARRTPLRIVGLGSWLDGGHPTSPDSRPVNLSALEGITEYTPGDVTLTARAGTPLSTIEAAAASENQWLPLDPFSIADHGGSIGATIATASAGPLAAGLGLPRDVVLGLEAVTGEGAVIRTGGRVVKNVAGFDLTRLLTGAWGTLAILTEVTVRLRGRPVCDETLVVVRRRARVGRGAREADGDGIDDLLQALRAAPAAPIALEVLNRSLATRLELPGGVDGPVALARITGNAERVAAERAALEAIGDAVPVVPQIWTALRRSEAGTGSGAAVLRWSQIPTLLGATWGHAGVACAPFADALVHASVARGIVRAVIPNPGSAPLAAAIAGDAAHSREIAGAVEPHATGFVGMCIPERLPPWLWGAVGARALRDPLSRRVRRAFDPAHILNPGVLGEEIERG